MEKYRNQAESVTTEHLHAKIDSCSERKGGRTSWVLKLMRSALNRLAETEDDRDLLFLSKAVGCVTVAFFNRECGMRNCEDGEILDFVARIKSWHKDHGTRESWYLFLDEYKIHKPEFNQVMRKALLRVLSKHPEYWVLMTASI